MRKSRFTTEQMWGSCTSTRRARRSASELTGTGYRDDTAPLQGDRPEQRRTAVMQAMDSAGITERRACRFTGFARSSQRYVTRRAPRRELRERLHTLAILRPRSGYRRLHVPLRREGHEINHKHTRRLYREEGLAVRQRKRKRVATARVVKPVVTAE